MISEQNYLTLGLPGAEAITSTIGANCHVGSVQSEDTALLICGRVNGDVSCTGAVIVAEGAHITGGITAKSALIAGSVVSPSAQNPSTIKIEGAVILQSTARVMCHVEAGALETSIGAVVEGMLSLNRGMRTLDAESATHKAATLTPLPPAQSIASELTPAPQTPAQTHADQPGSQGQNLASTADQHSQVDPAVTARLGGDVMAADTSGDPMQTVTSDEIQMDHDQFLLDMEQIKLCVGKGQEFAEQGEIGKLNAIIAELKAVELSQFQQFQHQAKTIIAEALQTLDALGQPGANQPKTPLPSAPSAFFQDGGAGFRQAGQ